MSISTHILDTSRGRPAAGVAVTLEQLQGDAWRVAGTGTTDADGRVRELWTAAAPPDAGAYRLRFEIAPYFTATGVTAFYPWVEIAFTIANGAEHHHVPLLLNPFGFSTYRGS